MSNDRNGYKPVINADNYNVSVDGNCVHYYVLEDDYKITITIETTEDSDKKEEAKGGEKDE